MPHLRSLGMRDDTAPELDMIHRPHENTVGKNPITGCSGYPRDI